MARWSNYGKMDSPVVRDGDAGWKGILMPLKEIGEDRGSVPAGFLSRGENVRLRGGTAAKRLGLTFPDDFNVAFTNIIIGSHVYSNPNGDEVMLVATKDANYVWALQFGKDPVQIPLASGTTGLGSVQFCQAFDKIYMFRFPVLIGTMYWDGLMTVPTFKLVPAPNAGSLIPNTTNGVPFQDRILLYNPYQSDTVYATDINTYNAYEPVMGTIRINSGEADKITSIFPYFRGTFLVFMRKSVHMVSGLDTTTLNNTSQRLLSAKQGGEGIFMPVMTGNDVIFLSDPGGFYRISEVIQEQITADSVPISEPIRPLINKIDWLRSRLFACSVSLNDYVYFTVCRKGYTGAADCMAVYNSVTKNWESAPDWFDDPDFRIDRLLVTRYNDEKRVFALDYARKQIYLTNDSVGDEIGGFSRPVKSVIETRGYDCKDPGTWKRFQRTIIVLNTFNPDAVVTAMTDGYNEEFPVATIKKDNTKFYTQDHPDFDPVNGDADEPMREDYSVADDDLFCIQDFEELPVGPIPFIPETPFGFEIPKQQTTERFPLRKNARHLGLRIESNDGACDVVGVGVEGIQIGETVKLIA